MAASNSNSLCRIWWQRICSRSPFILVLMAQFYRLFVTLGLLSLAHVYPRWGSMIWLPDPLLVVMSVHLFLCIYCSGCMWSSVCLTVVHTMCEYRWCGALVRTDYVHQGSGSQTFSHQGHLIWHKLDHGPHLIKMFEFTCFTAGCVLY